MLIKPITHSALFLSPFPGPLRSSEDPFFSFNGQGVQGYRSGIRKRSLQFA